MGYKLTPYMKFLVTRRNVETQVYVGNLLVLYTKG